MGVEQNYDPEEVVLSQVYVGAFPWLRAQLN